MVLLGVGNPDSDGPSPGNNLQASCRRPALSVASSGEVLAGSGNRRCLSSPVPCLDRVEPPTPPGADAAGSPVGLPRNARKTRNKRPPEPMAQLRSGTGAGSPPLDPQIRGRDPRSALSPASRQSPQLRAQRSTGAMTESRPQPTPRPDHKSVPAPCAPTPHRPPLQAGL